MSVPLVHVKKPSIQTLWLDTSVVSHLVKVLEKSRNPTDASLRPKLERLQELVFKLGQAGKLLCPQADQWEEYEEIDCAQEVAAKYAQLSSGVRLRHRYEVHVTQAHYAMEAMLEGKNVIELPLQVFFNGDPVEKLRRTRELGLVVSAFGKNPELAALRTTAKKKTVNGTNALHAQLHQTRRTFQEQLQVELRGHLEAFDYDLRQAWERMQVARHTGEHRALDLMPISRSFLQSWSTLAGPHQVIEGVRKFLDSDYYRALPHTRIIAHLWADLLTGQQGEVTTGDPMDVELLAVALPVSHFVLADNRMRLRVERLGLDKAWNVKMFSLKTSDQLFRELEALSA